MPGRVNLSPNGRCGAHRLLPRASISRIVAPVLAMKALRRASVHSRARIGRDGGHKARSGSLTDAQSAGESHLEFFGRLGLILRY